MISRVLLGLLLLFLLRPARTDTQVERERRRTLVRKHESSTRSQTHEEIGVVPEPVLALKHVERGRSTRALVGLYT